MGPCGVAVCGLFILFFCAAGESIDAERDHAGKRMLATSRAEVNVDRATRDVALQRN
ncbi:MAG: hypothetical protein ABI771_09135 [Betaproteobacteria bacterium]